MKKVAIGLLGTTLDAGKGEKRWQRWRPTIDLCRQESLPFDRLVLIYQARFSQFARYIAEDVAIASPDTEVELKEVEMLDPWDFEEVYGALHDFTRAYPFDPEHEEYYVHITTGSHVAQICLYLLTESKNIPGKLIQTVMPPKEVRDRLKEEDPDAPMPVGQASVIDLELARYDRIANRFASETGEALQYLKSGIHTKNECYNRLIERIEQVALRSKAPLLLTGPTGAGKSLLARRIYELKLSRHQIQGPFVEVNCATLRGEGAMSALFGHKRGAFTSAVSDRPGLLRAADRGVLFLDEIGELGLDEQAMLLRALEEKTFLPVGSDKEVKSDFQLLAGTNRDLREAVRIGTFREDLLARIDLWTFCLPGLKERLEDIEPNLEYELERFAGRTGRRVRFNREAHDRFLAFATSSRGKWLANFRDLGAAVERMATLAPGGRITEVEVNEEIGRLETAWESDRSQTDAADKAQRLLAKLLGAEALAEMDRFDLVQLADVVTVCRNSATLAAAGRTLFAASRKRRSVVNDADRIKKYLERFGLSFAEISAYDTH